MTKRCCALVLAALLLPRAAAANIACDVGGDARTVSFGSTSALDVAQTSAMGSPLRPSLKASPALQAANNPRRLSLGMHVVAAVGARLGGPAARSSDLVVLTDSGGCQLVRVPQQGPSTLGPGAPDLAQASTLARPLTCGPGSALVAGDVDGDGRDDVVLVTVGAPDAAGTVLSATLFLLREDGRVDAQDFTDALQSANVAWHAAGSPMALADVDGDGAIDLVLVSGAGSRQTLLQFSGLPAGQGGGFAGPPRTLIADLGLTGSAADADHPATGGSSCTPARTRGPSGLALADLDGDGNLDAVVAAPSQRGLRLFMGQSDGSFVAAPDIATPQGGAQWVYAADLDRDGTIDLFVARGASDCDGGTATGYMLRNAAGDASFALADAQMAAGGSPQSFATPLGRMLLDMQGTDVGWAQDLWLGSGSPDGDVAVWHQQVADGAYALTGRAQSRQLNGPLPASQALSCATLTDLQATIPAGTGIAVSLSPDGGAHWEALSAAEMAGEVPHNFVHLGQSLRWRIDFSAPPSALPDSQAAYAPAATLVPSVRALSLSWRLMGSGSFSRTGAVTARWNVGPTPTDFVLRTRLDYPGFFGHLEAQPLGTLAVGSALSPQAVTTQASWDAGEQLARRSGGSRVLYAAYPTGVSTAANATRVIRTAGVGLNALQLLLPSTSPSLQQMMGLSDAAKLATLNFLSSGMGDPAGRKLYDPGHATPAVLGPPSESASTMGSGYATYQLLQAGRGPAVLMGANDGLLHAFDATNGSEMWALAPYNLLAKLREQQGRQADGSAVYRHGDFVDGPTTIADIQAGGSWRTVAIVGQGEGLGLNGNNYYFAVDVTDARSPKPLWELTQVGAGTALRCDGQAATVQRPQCGNRSGLKCCGSGPSAYCAPSASSCAATPPAAMGQSFSRPAVGRLRTSAGDVWAAFFASGKNNLGAPNVGRTIYAVNAYTGAVLGTWDTPALPVAAGGPAIEPALPAGVTLVDADGDGYVDRLYVGDLAGRMFKLNTSATASLSNGSMGSPKQYALCTLFDAGQVANGGGARVWAPIASAAAAAVLGSQAVNVYFGTGGDDAAPASGTYTFYGVRDADALNGCSTRGPAPLDLSRGEFALRDATAGYRFWSEPTVLNNTAVYFSSFAGSTEQANPCASGASQAHLYGVAIRSFTDRQGRAYVAGQSVLSDGRSYWTVQGALRTAPAIRGAKPASVVRGGQGAPSASAPQAAADLLIQQADGTVLRLSSGSARLADAPTLRQVRWREINF